MGIRMMLVGSDLALLAGAMRERAALAQSLAG
jgi:hypothetical protein